MILIAPSIALLLDREFNHSRKYLEVPIREQIWLAKYMAYIVIKKISMSSYEAEECIQKKMTFGGHTENQESASHLLHYLHCPLPPQQPVLAGQPLPCWGHRTRRTAWSCGTWSSRVTTTTWRATRRTTRWWLRSISRGY